MRYLEIIQVLDHTGGELSSYSSSSSSSSLSRQSQELSYIQRFQLPYIIQNWNQLPIYQSDLYMFHALSRSILMSNCCSNYGESGESGSMGSMDIWSWKLPNILLVKVDPQLLGRFMTRCNCFTAGYYLNLIICCFYFRSSWSSLLEVAIFLGLFSTMITFLTLFFQLATSVTGLSLRNT